MAHLQSECHMNNWFSAGHLSMGMNLRLSQIWSNLRLLAHLKTCSCLWGSCFSTSDLSRRSRKGRSTPCSRSTTPCSHAISLVTPALRLVLFHPHANFCLSLIAKEKQKACSLKLKLVQCQVERIAFCRQWSGWGRALSSCRHSQVSGTATTNANC